MKSRIAWRVGYLICALGIYLVDQSSKSWAVRRLRFQDITVGRGVLDFVYAENAGIAALTNTDDLPSSPARPSYADEADAQ